MAAMIDALLALAERCVMEGAVTGKWLGCVGTYCLSAVLAAQERVVLGTAVNAEFIDRYWQSRRIADLPLGPATLVYFATVECPMVRRTLPRVGELAEEFYGRGVTTLVVNVGVGDAFVDAVGQVVEGAPRALFAKDAALQVASACGVDRSSYVVVLDRERRIRYRGMVEDQHGYSGSRPGVARVPVRDAIESVLAGKEVVEAETAVVGCRLSAPAKPDPQDPPTYLRDVWPILVRRCYACHDSNRDGMLALAMEVDVKKHAAMIVEVTGNGRMPPWHATQNAPEAEGSRALTLVEREKIRHWHEAGMPSGSMADSSQRHESVHTEWRLGVPDHVASVSEPVMVPATGSPVYHSVVLGGPFADDTWVQVIEVRSTASAALQHVNIACVPPGDTFAASAMIGSQIPHGRMIACAIGSAIRLPRGSSWVLQCCYLPTGTEHVDHLQVGLRFARGLVQKEVRHSVVSSTDFKVQPGDCAFSVAATMGWAEDANLLRVLPQMRTRGRDVTLYLLPEGGARSRLLSVPLYGFLNQEAYSWAQGVVDVQCGTVLRAVAHFDNSAWNPANPDPRAVVAPGAAITEECMDVHVWWTSKKEALRLNVDGATGRALPNQR